MYTASIAKLYILETLLLQHQDADDQLDDNQRQLAVRMIENSDNEAANDLYIAVGEAAGLRHAAFRLGVRNTVPGEGIFWGFTKTCAADYIALLTDLYVPGVLSAASRHFVRDLMSHIEADQDWGVSAVADAHTPVLLKNGWLAADPDGGRWIVNSVGIVVVHGHRTLIAVLTQHGADYAGGISLVEKITRISVAALPTG